MIYRSIISRSAASAAAASCHLTTAMRSLPSPVRAETAETTWNRTASFPPPSQTPRAPRYGGYFSW